MIVKLQSGHEISLQMIKGKELQNIQSRVMVLCMTHCLIVRYKCVKFQPNGFNSVQLTERTRNCIYLRYKGDNLKNICARVMVLVHDTSSQIDNVLYKCMKFR